MEIETLDDIKILSGEMHDSEFKLEDFGYDSEKKIFYLKTRLPEKTSESFLLEFYNVEEYNPVNLEKIKMGNAMGGVFNKIKIRDNGLTLEIISQDLKILLKLSKLGGRFERIE
jgi:hypothetical protein